MVRIFLAVLLLVAAPCRAQEAPTLGEWLKQERKDAGAFPRRIAFVTGFGAAGEAPKFMDLPAADFERASYLRAADPRSAAWDFKLNKDKFSETAAKELVFALTGADAVLVAPGKGEWELLGRRAGKVSTLFKRRRPPAVTAPAIADWLLSGLGWDGVVLDRRADYLLVGSTAAALKTPEIQALAVGDTRDKIKLGADERKGAGLLSLSASDGGFGVFDVVFLGAGVKSIPTGTKLIIERRVKDGLKK